MSRFDRVRAACWILGCVLAPRDVDVTIGDLEEEYALRSQSLPRQAAAWYWTQVLRSIPAFMWAAVRRGGVLATIGVATGAIVLQAMVELGSKTAMRSALPPDSSLLVALTSAVALPTLLLVSYVAARLRPGAALMMTALILIAVVIQLAMRGDVSLWHRLAMLVIGPSLAFTGGALAYRNRAG